MTTIAPNRLRTTAYWIATAVLGTECIVGGVMGTLQMLPFLDTATHLGYPTYFMSILGAWYISAGFVLLAPRLPRLTDGRMPVWSSITPAEVRAARLF